MQYWLGCLYPSPIRKGNDMSIIDKMNGVQALDFCHHCKHKCDTYWNCLKSKDKNQKWRVKLNKCISKCWKSERMEKDEINIRTDESKEKS